MRSDQASEILRRSRGDDHIGRRSTLPHRFGIRELSCIRPPRVGSWQRRVVRDRSTLRRRRRPGVAAPGRRLRLGVKGLHRGGKWF